MIAAAVTGPTPGNVSSSSTVAAFRSTKPPGAGVFPSVGGASFGAAAPGPELIELPIADGCPGAATIPTMICSPSVTRRAMFNPIRSAPSRAPPAAVSASAIRAPGANVTSPGLSTRPTTLTTTGPSALGGAGPGVGLPDETISTGGSFADATGGVLARTALHTVPRTALAPTTA